MLTPDSGRPGFERALGGQDRMAVQPGHSAARSAAVRFRSPTRSPGADELRPDLECPGTDGFGPGRGSAALYAAKPAAGAIAERTLAEYLTGRLGGRAVGAAGWDGWKIAGISEALCEEFSPRRRAIEPRLKELIGAYERKHPRAPNARARWSMTRFVALDSWRVKAHSAPTRAALLARWEARKRQSSMASEGP